MRDPIEFLVYIPPKFVTVNSIATRFKLDHRVLRKKIDELRKMGLVEVIKLGKIILVKNKSNIYAPVDGFVTAETVLRALYSFVKSRIASARGNVISFYLRDVLDSFKIKTATWYRYLIYTVIYLAKIRTGANAFVSIEKGRGIIRIRLSKKVALELIKLLEDLLQNEEKIKMLELLAPQCR